MTETRCRHCGLRVVRISKELWSHASGFFGCDAARLQLDRQDDSLDTMAEPEEELCAVG